MSEDHGGCWNITKKKQKNRKETQQTQCTIVRQTEMIGHYANIQGTKQTTVYPRRYKLREQDRVRSEVGCVVKKCRSRRIP